MSAVTLEAQIGARAASYVGEVMRRTRAELGAQLVGVWLLGSAVLGDFHPSRSDIDIQAVTAARLPEAERRQLAAALSHRSLPCPARGLELVLYNEDDLRSPEGPAFQLNLNTGERWREHVAFRPGDHPRFWFVLDVSIGREHARPLYGPEFSSVFPPPPRELVLQSLRRALDWYGRNEGAAADTVLSACRAWAFARDGRWLSKTAAGKWARARLPDPAPVDGALAIRAGAGDLSLEDRQVASVLSAARAAIGVVRGPS